MIEKGTTRLVFIFKYFVIKIPNFTYSHLHFLNGCYANWSERNFCKIFKNMPEFYNKVAPSIFCSWFGIIQIQKYCKPLNREITEAELMFLENVRGGESKRENFGIYNNNIVCLDYP